MIRDIPKAILGALVMLVVVLILAGIAYGQWQHRRAIVTQQRLERAQGSAAVQSARDTIATQEASQAREKASDELTRTNAEEIRNAKGSADPVNPAARDAGLLALCRRESYRSSERCRVLKHDPK